MHRGQNYAIVSCGNIGYKIYLDEKVRAKEETELFVYHQIREDASDLYGFEKPADLEIFEMLLQVSGVGPKVAMLLVNGLGRDKIISAITKSDTTIFRSVPGVGAKVAAKIIVELKSKISKGDFGDAFLQDEDETVEALVSLGLKKQEILPLMREIPDSVISVQDKVKYILKNAGKRK